jgi:MYXO-CTERM domain-containing protein
MGRVGEEAESGQLVLVLLLGLIVTRRRRRVAIIGVIVEVAKGGEEGALLGLGFLEVLLLERLLIGSSL